MGLSLGLVTLDGKIHPKFQIDKWSGIGEMLDLITHVPMKKSREPTWLDEIYYTAPIDRAAFSNQIVPKCNKELWQSFVDILSTDPDYWIKVEY